MFLSQAFIRFMKLGMFFSIYHNNKTLSFTILCGDATKGLVQHRTSDLFLKKLINGEELIFSRLVVYYFRLG